MDWSKYPIEKLFYFVAALIPGFTALLIYYLAVPHAFGWFFGLGFIGYKTKIALVLVTAFVIGNSLTTFLWGMLGALGGVVGSIRAQQPFRPWHMETVAPWRDARWRGLLKNRLGGQSPNDTRLIPDELLALRRQAIDNLPPDQRQPAHAQLSSEKINAEIDDSNWAQWYDHYHHVVFSREAPDIRWYVRRGLDVNLEATAVYVLISVAFVPEVRHWWSVLPAILWTLILVAQEYSSARRYLDKWSTLSDQIKYLAEGGV